MLPYMIIFGLFLNLSMSHPFILDKFVDFCVFNSSHNFSTTIASKLWKIENNNIVIYYTLCGYVPERLNCGVHVTACLKNKNDDLIEVIQKKFIVDNKTLSFKVIDGDHRKHDPVINTDIFSLETTSSTACKHNPMKKFKLVIKFNCQEDMKEQHLEVLNDCEYVIHRMSPECEPKCTTKISGLLVDLRPLRGRSFSVHSEGRNFSITLCDTNRNCALKDNSDASISSCERNYSEIIPLSNSDSELLLYNQEKNELTIHGSYKGALKRDDKKFEIVLKCNWDTTGTNVSYKTVSTQGKHYEFKMESSYGCIKLPSLCTTIDKSNTFFVYNLTALYSNKGYIEVSSAPKGKMYINICGPLHLPLKDENACSRSYSQVCEVNNGNYINKGSILSKFKVVDDVIAATFINGAKCKENSSMQYSTHINFFCSKTEEGPKFVSYNLCNTFLNWNTPLACPQYDKIGCEGIHQDSHPCSANLEGYNLNRLTVKKGNYEVEDYTNSSIKYLLNVCSPAIDPSAPCLKDSMILLKDLSQINLKYRFKSLGKMDKIFADNNQVIIRSSSGLYCGTEGDYTSTIRFICSDTQATPLLVNRTQCTFNFEWETPHACPKKENNNEKMCLLRDSEANISIDFAAMRQTSVQIKHNRTLLFDFCKDNYTECLDGKKNCSHLPAQRKLMTHNKRTYLEIILPKKSCHLEKDITKVVFELTCDTILNNEHYDQIGFKNCTVMMKLSTNLICSKEELSEDYKYQILNEEKEKENCSVTNHNTGYKLYISSLKLDIPNLDCPKVVFNSQNSSVLLIYTSDQICEEQKGYGVYTYKIFLKCAKEAVNHTEETACSKIYKLGKPEFCPLFDTSILDSHPATTTSSSTTGIMIGSVLGVLSIVGICVFCFLRKRQWIPRASPYSSIYEKNADL